MYKRQVLGHGPLDTGTNYLVREDGQQNSQQGDTLEALSDPGCRDGQDNRLDQDGRQGGRGGHPEKEVVHQRRKNSGQQPHVDACLLYTSPLKPIGQAPPEVKEVERDQGEEEYG